MRTASIITSAIAAAAIGTLALPPISANAADSAIVTIGQLQAQGFNVQVDRIGSAPLSQCEVTDVRNPQERSEFIRVDRFGGRDRVVPIVVARTVSVSLDCSSR